MVNERSLEVRRLVLDRRQRDAAVHRPAVEVREAERVREELAALGPVRFVRLNIYPDGGIARFRVYGRDGVMGPTEPLRELSQEFEVTDAMAN